MTREFCQQDYHKHDELEKTVLHLSISNEDFFSPPDPAKTFPSPGFDPSVFQLVFSTFFIKFPPDYPTPFIKSFN
jgi:hypothetical protein